MNWCIQLALIDQSKDKKDDKTEDATAAPESMEQDSVRRIALNV